LMNLDMFVMAADPISTAYFINPSHQSVCLYVCPSYRVYFASLLGNTFPRQWAHAIIKVFLYICVNVGPCVSITLLGKNSEKYSRGNEEFARGVDFYAIRVVWEECKRLVLARISCFKYCILSEVKEKPHFPKKCMYIVVFILAFY
jgi:hypothetical protein